MTMALWIIVTAAVAAYPGLHEDAFLRPLAPLARHRIALFLCMVIDLLNQLFNEGILV